MILNHQIKHTVERDMGVVKSICFHPYIYILDQVPLYLAWAQPTLPIHGSHRPSVCLRLPAMHAELKMQRAALPLCRGCPAVYGVGSWYTYTGSAHVFYSTYGRGALASRYRFSYDS